MADVAHNTFLRAIEELRPRVPAGSEDLLEDAILKLWIRVSAGTVNTRNFGGMIVKILRDLWVDRARRERSSQALQHGLTNGGESEWRRTPLVDAMLSEEATMLHVAIGSLSEPTQFVVRARLRGAGFGTIARELIRSRGERYTEPQLRYLWAEGVRRLTRILT